jgi:hypothetical protein
MLLIAASTDDTHVSLKAHSSFFLVTALAFLATGAASSSNMLLRSFFFTF